MDQRCKNCPHACKKLDPQDDPAHYLFTHSTPTQVIEVIESVVQEHCGRFLHVTDTATSMGNQIAVIIEYADRPQEDNCLEQCFVLIGQAESKRSQMTDMWLRYGIPEQYCERPSVVSEMVGLIQRILDRLLERDQAFASLRAQPQPG